MSHKIISKCLLLEQIIILRRYFLFINRNIIKYIINNILLFLSSLVFRRLDLKRKVTNHIVYSYITTIRIINQIIIIILLQPDINDCLNIENHMFF